MCGTTLKEPSMCSCYIYFRSIFHLLTICICQIRYNPEEGWMLEEGSLHVHSWVKEGEGGRWEHVLSHDIHTTILLWENIYEVHIWSGNKLAFASKTQSHNAIGVRKECFLLYLPVFINFTSQCYNNSSEGSIWSPPKSFKCFNS